MGVIYKITDRVWGISDMPWPFFYGIRVFVFLKLFILLIIFLLITATYPFLYIYGVWYLIKKKKKPNWLYFVLYTALMGWYIFCIVRYLILGYPTNQTEGWPYGDKSIKEIISTQPYNDPYAPREEKYSPGKVYNYKFKPEESSPSSNIYDEYQDRLDDYLDDPEDEIRFDPEIFDFQDD